MAQTYEGNLSRFVTSAHEHKHAWFYTLLFEMCHKLSIMQCNYSQYCLHIRTLKKIWTFIVHFEPDWCHLFLFFLKKNNLTRHVCSDSKHHQDLKHSDWVNHFYKNDSKVTEKLIKVNVQTVSCKFSKIIFLTKDSLGFHTCVKCFWPNLAHFLRCARYITYQYLFLNNHTAISQLIYDWDHTLIY